MEYNMYIFVAHLHEQCVPPILGVPGRHRDLDDVERLDDPPLELRLRSQIAPTEPAVSQPGMTGIFVEDLNLWMICRVCTQVR